MPGNLLAAAALWLASHLVLLILTGFLVIGLWLFGVIEGPSVSGWRTQQPDRVGAPVDRHENVAPAPGVGSSDPLAGGTQTPSDAETAAARRPRMIGGSLPIYEIQDPRSPDARVRAGHRELGFRPQADTADPPPVYPGTAAPVSREAHLQGARKAFWNGDFEAAEAAYMDMIGDFPGDPDAFGELGNLYQSMSRPQQALDAFFEAGRRLRAAGEHQRLQEVIDLLRDQGDPRADQLH